ncbi:uncharacterized protein KZ484_011674 isoform 3-T3 [Pholidichthys leucotaenia]
MHWPVGEPSSGPPVAGQRSSLMDVSIAVSLIRGQMGTVVERAVNVAVETVLAEMLKVVGAKFEELKAQVVLLKRDLTALQREKSLKEKENENMRAKLRYTELKLKYYRQGVEEELQRRASSATAALDHLHPPSGAQMQRETLLVSPCDRAGSSSAQTRSSEGNVSWCPEDADPAQCEEDTCCWTITLKPHTGAVDAAMQLGQRSVHTSMSPEASAQADGSTLNPSALQSLKQEVQQQQEEEEVICIKEEPEEQQQQLGAPPLDCQVQQVETEGQRLGAGRSRLPPVAPGSAGASGEPQTCSPLTSAGCSQPHVPARPAPRPWNKELSLYEEFKMRRNELRRRSLSRRRELEKSLPQPLLADLVRERREKTRLRVARWRAKRKLQAILNQAQAPGGAAALSQTAFPDGAQQARPSCAVSSSGNDPRRSSAAVQSSGFISGFIPSSSSLMPGLGAAAHEHAAVSSSSFPQVGVSQQSICLTDADIFQ